MCLVLVVDFPCQAGIEANFVCSGHCSLRFGVVMIMIFTFQEYNIA